MYRYRDIIKREKRGRKGEERGVPLLPVYQTPTKMLPFFLLPSHIHTRERPD